MKLSFLVICLILSMIIPVHGEHWSDPIPLPFDNIYWFRVATSIENNVCMVSTGNSPRPVQASFFEDGSWTPPYDLSESDYCTGARICADPRGGFHVTWKENDSTLNHRRYTIENGWSEAVQTGIWSGGGEIVCDPDGLLYMFFVKHPDINDHLYVKIFNGQYWSHELSMIAETGIHKISVAADRYEGVHVFSETYIYDQHFHVFNDLTWTFNENNFHAYPSLDIDALNRRHVTASKQKSEDVPGYLYYLCFSGDSFNFDDSVYVSYDPDMDYHGDFKSYLIVDPFLNVHIGWQRNYCSKPIYSFDICYRDFPFVGESVTRNWNLKLSEHIRATTVDRDGNYHLFTIGYNDFGEDNTNYHIIRYRDTPGVRLDLSSQVYNPGETFNLKSTILNPTSQPLSADLMICLDVYGELFWYPSWGAQPEQLPVNIESNGSLSLDILDFIMPDFTGDSGPFYLYAGLFTPETGELTGDPSGIGFVLKH